LIATPHASTTPENSRTLIVDLRHRHGQPLGQMNKC
jgi:hypothetical protein